MQPIITENREGIIALCRAHHVRRLSAFGSAVRDDFDPERSDVDLLVEFDLLPFPDSIRNQESLRDALKSLFDREIDLIRAGTVRNPYIRRAIEKDQELLYAA
jgi:predicted nucleotidyltransferase